MAKKNTLIKLKKKEKELRRAALIEAAREVFGRKTYDKVSMSEIAGQAGIAKSSIYTYFKNQEELYARVTCQDTEQFIKKLEKKIEKNSDDIVKTIVDFFLEYFIEHTSQWRMITHFALHGNKDMASVGTLNATGRRLMDLFESVFKKACCSADTRLMSHTLFSCLSGVLIAFKNYPGRTEKEKTAHMMKIGDQISQLLNAFIREKR